MLQNPCMTLGFEKNMVYKIPPGGGGKPYPASGLNNLTNKMKEESLYYTKIYKYMYIRRFGYGVIC